MKKAILSGVLALMAAAAPAATLEYTYDPTPGAESFRGYGFSKKETYDVAIRLNDPTLVGARITGMSVNIPVSDGMVDNVSAWLSSELKLEGKKNAPDIMSKDGVVAERMISVTFDEPYTLTADGVYVGYSFNVVELGDYSTSPVAVRQAENCPDGFFLHTSRTRLKWTDEYATSGFVSVMKVMLEINGGATDVAVSLAPQAYAADGKGTDVTLTLANYGTMDLTEIGYSWTAGSDNGTGSYTLPMAVAPGERTTALVPVGPFSGKGNRTLSVTVDTFNGQPNGDARRTATGALSVLPFIPVNRPVVEEFTGMRCGYCPRGYVSLEQMGHKYPDLFIGMAYHTRSYESDGMVIMTDDGFPVAVSGYPYGTLNREAGLSMAPPEVSEAWETARLQVAPADIDVSLEWTDDSHTALRAMTSARFAIEYSNVDFRLALALVADNMKREGWVQLNNYAGSSETGDFWDIFTKGGSIVRDITFNDVLVSFDDVKGVKGSVPADITFDSNPALIREFVLADIRNLEGNNFLTDDCTLHAVALLLDGRTGAVLNANKSASLSRDTSGIDTVAGDAVVVTTEWYSLQGVRLDSPTEGELMICVERMSDGTLRTSKRK